MKSDGYFKIRDCWTMMHMFRLLYSGENILREGVPIVRFTGSPLKFLKSILKGAFQYDELIALAEERLEVLAKLNTLSSLPGHANLTEINNLLRHITESWETQHAR